MTKNQIEVITSVERRRRWTAAEKERLVAASLEPDAVVSMLARDAGVHPSQLYAWRRALCARRPAAAADFAAVRIASDAVTAAVPAPLGVIEIEFAGGARMRISGAVDAPSLSAAVAALAMKDRPR
jgi:transposase